MFFSVSDIRSAFLKYFAKQGHEQVASSSLVPDNDPTLLFTNSGMVQFKDVFTGKKKLPFNRATTSQKSLRAGGKHNDLENVGYTARHHTFFEMLGNFSFGDYFKEQAIHFAFEFITKELAIPIEKLLVTVHSSDEEAASFWKKIAGFSDSKIIRIPTDDNFWSMGDTGPCGPCSEIFYDHGEKIAGGIPGSKDQDGDRFIEIWNLVFMQFETLPDGSRISLPTPSIDTGMGLERISAVMQGVHNNYDIDLFRSIIHDIKTTTGKEDDIYMYHNRVIADHIRAISFMISDGIIPSNEGRGYVLRRIIRRAMRHGYMMGMRDPFLHSLIDSVVKVMGGHYEELSSNKQTIMQVLRLEEEGFIKTIDKGMHILQDELKKSGQSSIFPADVAYKLYDTFGFPFDLTQDILRVENKMVDEAEFSKIANSQREASKKAWAGTGDSFTAKVWFDIKEKIPEIEFIREAHTAESEVLFIVSNDGTQDLAKTGEEVFIISNKTPFYAESGGQIGDIGTISSQKAVADVMDTKIIEGIIVHKCLINHGILSVGDKITMEINQKTRLKTSKNHTATHILHKALRDVLGTHVTQKGSLVTPHRLRFDFIHNEPISKEDLSKIENIIRTSIDKSLPIRTTVMETKEAIKSGAMALFGEKYPEKSRVVSIGEDFSKELCGGEHISNTSQIGAFKIISISSIGSGIKRIEALTGDSVREFLESELDAALDKIQSQISSIKSLEKQIVDIKNKITVDTMNLQIQTFADIELSTGIFNDIDQKSMLAMIDSQKQSDSKKLVLICNKSTNKLSLCLFISKKLSADVDARDVMAFLLNFIDADVRFGGRNDLVQLGGLDISKTEDMLKGITEYMKRFL